MSKIKVIVNGARGKMGLETVSAVSKESDLDLVAKLDVGDNLSALIKEKKADVVVDFTHPKSAFQNIKTILEADAHAVVGTTGLTIDDLKKIEDIRSTSFDSLASSTTISDPRMNKLSDASGSITVEDCPLTVCKNGEEDDVKQVTLEITWQDGTQTKQSKLTTLVSKNGL